MKLLLTSASFQGGGIASYAIELVSSYSQDFEMTVIIGDDSLSPLSNYGATVYHYDMADTSEKNARAILHLIETEIQPDVIINSFSRVMPLITPYLNNKVKVINVSHSLRYDEADIAGLNNEYADTIIALSDFNRKYLEEKFKCNGKVKVVNNFVRSDPNQQIVLNRKLSKRPLNIVFSGGGTAAKSPEIICRIAYQLLKTDLNFNFIWIGIPSPPLKKIQFFKEIKEIMPDDPRLFMKGRLSREEAIEITKNANIFLTPSKREGCPMALIEAMSIGTISITSDYENGCKEIIQDGYNGFVIDHRNIAGFVNIIKDILLNPDKYNHIYYNSYKTFQNELSFSSWKSKMDEIILNNNCNHKERRKEFNLREFKMALKIQSRMTKRNLCHKLLFEYLPSALHFVLFYIKSKLS